MKRRKNVFTKIVSLVITVLFTCQCAIIKKGEFIRTENTITQNGYEYRFEKIKTPTPGDCTAVYKIVKIPQVYAEIINVYKKMRIPNRFIPGLFGFICGALLGQQVEIGVTREDISESILPGIRGAGLGGLLGLITALAVTKKEKVVGEIKEPGTSLQAIPNSTFIPFQSQPVEIKLHKGSDVKSFKTFTDNEGMLKVNLKDNLGLQDVTAGVSFDLEFIYINSEMGNKVNHWESIHLLPSSQK